jgi:Flp pilus assembly protein TadD
MYLLNILGKVANVGRICYPTRRRLAKPPYICPDLLKRYGLMFKRVLHISLAAAILVVALLFVFRPLDDSYLQLLRQGDELAGRAERTAAVAVYREAARLRPDDPLPHLRLAQLYLDWGRTDDALDAIAQARRLGAGEIDRERLWVAVHVSRADWPAVVEHARRLLSLAPDERDVRHTLARAHVELREWDAARTEYQALLSADPTDSLAHERMGVLLLGDDDAAAIQHLFAARTELADRLLAARFPPSFPPHGGDERGGDAAYTAASLGLSLLEARGWALASLQFERALAYDPDYPDARAYLGYALDHLGYSDEAGPHWQQAVALAPNSAAAHTFLGLYYERLGDVASARAEYETAYDLDPNNPAICVEIGQTWAAEGRYTEAEIWLREAVSLQPDDPTLWKVLVHFYLDHNIAATGRGVEAAARLVQLVPDDAGAHDLRGWAALQVGDYEQAEESLRRAVALDPTLAATHYHLGLLWSVRGLRQDAQEAFVRALDLDTTGELRSFIERAMLGKP